MNVAASVRLLIVLGSLASSGCAEYVAGKVWLDRPRADVYVTRNASEVAACTLLKPVNSKSYWGGLALQSEALEKCVAVLTKEAKQAGANVLLLQNESKSMMGSSAYGEAYLCKDMTFTNAAVQTAPSLAVEASAPAAPPAGDISERLRKLKQLKDDGILTEEEYQEKRKGLVEQL